MTYYPRTCLICLVKPTWPHERIMLQHRSGFSHHERPMPQFMRAHVGHDRLHQNDSLTSVMMHALASICSITEGSTRPSWRYHNAHV